MIVTVPDYARFLISVMREQGYDSKLAGERNRAQTDKGDERVVDCKPEGAAACPRSQGYGLGLSAMPDVISVLDPHCPYLPYYRTWLAREAEKECSKAPRR